MSRQRDITRANWALAATGLVFAAAIVAVVVTGASVPALGLDAGDTRIAVIGAFLVAVGTVYATFAEAYTVWLAARVEGVDDLDAVEVASEDVAQRRRGALLMVFGGLVVFVFAFV
ncbi:hypothetical protein [Haloarchaeobius sp. HRN-SO-5]|uniref:hypothetical protein n=1 Tax=Haloarchaeobius sp. HRN-SO-5 TaxID=3446118 RepID=UPI003EBB70F8